MAGNASNYLGGGTKTYGDLVGYYSGKANDALNTRYNNMKSNFVAQAPQINAFGYIPGLKQAGDNAFGGMDQQQALADALLAQANGQGPSLAALQLQQATDANAAQAAGAVASQRGINPALAARLVGQQQANAQQQAAGQAAQLRIQEQLAAREQLAGVLAQMRGQNLETLGAFGGLNQGQNAILSQGDLGAQQLNQSTAAQNAQLAAGMSAQAIAKAQADKARSDRIVGGVIGGIGAVGGTIIGGPVGGAVGAQAGNIATSGGSPSGGAGYSGSTAGMVPASYTPSAHISPGTLQQPTMAGGGVVPGYAPSPGDSHDNDTVPAMLSPGEVVIPRSIVNAEDAPDRAAEFVAAIKRKKPSEHGGYAQFLKIRREIDDRLAQLQAFAYGGKVCR